MSSLIHWSDTFVVWAHGIVEPITMISNLYLIFVAVIYSPAPMKVYSSLIIYHSAFDVFASLSILMASPRFVGLRRARMYVFHGLCRYIGESDFCYIWNDFMIHALSHSMLSIVISFCYRYYILKAGSPTMKKMFIFLVVIWTPSLFQWVTFYYAQDPNEVLMEIAKDYPPYDKYLDMVVWAGTKDYLEWKTLISNVYLGCGAGMMFPVTYFLRRLIIRKLQENTTMSEKTKQMHANLLRVLSFQSISPIIFTICFIPFTLMSLDIYRHPIMENSVFGFCGLIPAMDSFVNLILIKAYRQAAVSHIMKVLKIANLKQSKVTTITSISNPSS